MSAQHLIQTAHVSRHIPLSRRCASQPQASLLRALNARPGRFYLKGSGTNNPAAKYSKMALQQINLIYDVYLQFKPVVDSCPAIASELVGSSGRRRRM